MESRRRLQEPVGRCERVLVRSDTAARGGYGTPLRSGVRILLQSGPERRLSRRTRKGGASAAVLSGSLTGTQGRRLFVRGWKCPVFVGLSLLSEALWSSRESLVSLLVDCLTLRAVNSHSTAVVRHRHALYEHCSAHHSLPTSLQTHSLVVRPRRGSYGHRN